MLEFLLELLLQVFMEATFGLAADVLSSLLVRIFEWTFDQAEIATPLFAFLAYLCFGTVAGGLSLLPFPRLLTPAVQDPGLS
jgi:hypothetical protein